MTVDIPYQFFADVILLLHFAIVVFVVGGLALVLVGNLRGWRWVNNLWLRMAHITAIGVVVIQSWLGQLCPLTILETWLREQAGGVGYSQSFIEYWVQRILFYEAPFWVFTVTYTLFGLLVVATWRYFPPHKNTGTKKSETNAEP